MKKIEKRYEHYTTKGVIVFTPWFLFQGNDRPKWQLNGKLRNEYRESSSQNA